MNSRDRATGNDAAPDWQLFLLVFAILALANAAATLLVRRYAGVDRAWWPVYLGAFLTLSCLYALLFTYLVRGTALARRRNAALYTAALALSLAAHTILFYSVPIDWLAVNTQKVKLTLGQQIVRSNLTPWVTYGLFLIGAALIARRKK